MTPEAEQLLKLMREEGRPVTAPSDPRLDELLGAGLITADAAPDGRWTFKAVPWDGVVPDATEPMLQWFEYKHLPVKLRVVSEWFHGLAHHLVGEIPRSPERTTALRKLLESKDAAVRAAL